MFYEDVQMGDEMPELTVTVDETQLFFFSAATYNGHRIHYDKEWARTVEGYDDVWHTVRCRPRCSAGPSGTGSAGVGAWWPSRAEPRDRPSRPGSGNFGGMVTGKRDGGLVDLDIFCRRGDAC